MSKPTTSARMLVVGVFIASILTGACGCASAVRVVHETPSGGEIVMPTNTNQWPTYYRSRAVYLMSQKCPDGYRIDRESAIGGPTADPAVHRGFESYFGNTGGSDADQVYHITFHGTPPGNRPPTDVPTKAEKGNSSERRFSPATGEDKEELPLPRPIAPSDKRP